MNAHSLHRVGTLRRFRPKLWIALVLAVMLIAAHLSVSAQESTRKVKRSVQPQYPELAKRLNLRGTVRLQLLIAPDGKVKEVKVLGGGPLLAQAAVDAVGKWLFEAEPQASTMVVKFDFNP